MAGVRKLIALYSPHGTHDATYLANYAYINLNDPMARSYGVGQTTVFGAGQYAMRLWVNPDQLAKLGITVTDIVNAIITPPPKKTYYLAREVQLRVFQDGWSDIAKLVSKDDCIVLIPVAISVEIGRAHV